MQYHQNGFRAGDPSVSEAAVDGTERRDVVDVLIIGCGPAGLTLAAQLSQFATINTRIVERKPGPLEIGQADGVACRSMEMFEAFGFADKVAKEAYWVNETTFWRPASNGTRLQRADRMQDVEDGLSEFPHTILNQARVHDFYLDVMRRSPRRLQPDYNLDLRQVIINEDQEHPVTATFTRLAPDLDSETETVRARYVVGCDGARSSVRRSLGLELKGVAARQLWGVMDVLAVTDFPDIRRKCAIQSAVQGSLLVIPREGGHMVRLYIELDDLSGDERVADRNLSVDTLTAKARAILHPYSLDVKEVPWWSAYEIGQRVCDSFDDVPDGQRMVRSPRVLIAGDSCHTHSPKAGQGMNVSMADSFNLGWKLAAVVNGEASTHLLHTYSAERRAKAQELIDFDRDMARLFSEKSKSPEQAAQFQRYFKKHSRYTAGVETRYAPSIITGGDEHQALAPGFQIGTRFHSAPVVRLADAKPMHLGHVMKADGRWRFIVFAPSDDCGQESGTIAALCHYLSSDSSSPFLTYAASDAASCSRFDLRVVFQPDHRGIVLDSMPDLLLPQTGRYGLTDYEKIFCADQRHGFDIFDLRSINRATGVFVIVRPDQFVADVRPITSWTSLAAFFEPFMI